MKTHRLMIVFTAVLALVVSSLRADVSMRARAVDVFQLKDGTRLLGVLLPSADGEFVRILLRKKWLQQNVPDLYATAVNQQDERQSAPEGIEQLLSDHIESLRKADEPHLERIGYLEERLEGLRNQGEEKSEPQLVILQLSRKLIRNQVLKRPEFRQVAGLAILNKLEKAETESPAALNRQLQTIAPDQRIRDLPTRPEAGENQAQNQLNRLLLQTDRLLGKTSRIIRQNGLYISESAAQQNPQVLATQLLSGQLTSQLQDLLGDEFATKPKPAGNAGPAPTTLPRQAQAIAERENADLVELTSMDLNAVAGTAQVSLTVYHKGSKAPHWSKVLAVVGSAGQQDVTEDRQKQISDDPRVKQITQLFNGLGAGQNQLTRAISIGAVVEVAQQRAKAELTKSLQQGLTAQAGDAQILEARLSKLPTPQK